MRKYRFLMSFVLLLMLAQSCTTSSQMGYSSGYLSTRGNSYKALYEERPISILIMPPINNTVDVDAKDYFYTSLFQPLCDRGYYVFSPFLMMEMLKNESAYDAELFLERDLKIFNDMLGADLVLFTQINEWSKGRMAGNITVSVDYMLKSAKTNEVVFQRTGEFQLDTNIKSGSGGIAGLLADMITTSIYTSMIDKMVAARRCNDMILEDFPFGVYNPLYMQDLESPSMPQYIRQAISY